MSCKEGTGKKLIESHSPSVLWGKKMRSQRKILGFRFFSAWRGHDGELDLASVPSINREKFCLSFSKCRSEAISRSPF